VGTGTDGRSKAFGGGSGGSRVTAVLQGEDEVIGSPRAAAAVS
jgi:hypothetical protein